ncbi:hypothetical protein VTP01DRAFT_3835 [Rhizomucor pusillus]|uniref:uncharacterized protein n=1 Tax=Rhizomucor pusillus TaxID=4840 RepID=UPI0037430391
MPKAKCSRKSRTNKIQADKVSSAPEISKDQKRKERHEAWLEKLDHSYKTKKKLQKQKRTQLAADLSDFNDILTAIQDEQSAKAAESAEATKAAPVKSSDKFRSEKAKRRAELAEMGRFQKVLKLPAFQQNPLAAIRQHVQNTFGNNNNSNAAITSS